MILSNTAFDKNVSARATTLAMILMLIHHLWTVKSVGGVFVGWTIWEDLCRNLHVHFRIRTDVFIFVRQVQTRHKTEADDTSILVCYVGGITSSFPLA